MPKKFPGSKRMHVVMPVVLMLVMGLALLVMGFILNRNSTTDVRFLSQSATYMGTHRVIVKPGSFTVRQETRGESTNKTHYWYCADINVRLDPTEELWVNEHPYGILPADAEVLIQDSKVYVNGQEARVEYTTVEHKDFQTVKDESQTVLVGHDIIVRPGSLMKTRMSGLNEHSLKIGDTIITIDEDILVVNDIRYGTINEHDAITVDHFVVYVNGKRRDPQ